ncbi:MAG: hypothetical protein LZF62_460008 [Nitrospira sp.]|nr:MAG: hypothetical protein LZF62_460008 [Nitrospira sp.]
MSTDCRTKSGRPFDRGLDRTAWEWYDATPDVPGLPLHKRQGSWRHSVRARIVSFHL